MAVLVYHGSGAEGIFGFVKEYDAIQKAFA
jgi:hypothetical protein